MANSDGTKFQPVRLSEIPRLWDHEESTVVSSVQKTNVRNNNGPQNFMPVRLTEMSDLFEGLEGGFESSVRKTNVRNNNAPLQKFMPVRLSEMPEMFDCFDNGCQSATKKIPGSLKKHEEPPKFQPVRLCDMPEYFEFFENNEQSSTKKIPGSLKKNGDPHKFQPVRLCDMPEYYEFFENNGQNSIVKGGCAKKQNDFQPKRLYEMPEIKDYPKKKPRPSIKKHTSNKENKTLLKPGKVIGKPNIKVETQINIPTQKKSTASTKSRLTTMNPRLAVPKITVSHAQNIKTKPTLPTIIDVETPTEKNSPDSKSCGNIKETLSHILQKLNSIEKSVDSVKLEINKLNFRTEQNNNDLSMVMKIISNSSDSIYISARSSVTTEKNQRVNLFDEKFIDSLDLKENKCPVKMKVENKKEENELENPDLTLENKETTLTSPVNSKKVENVTLRDDKSVAETPNNKSPGQESMEPDDEKETEQIEAKTPQETNSGEIEKWKELERDIATAKRMLNSLNVENTDEQDMKKSNVNSKSEREISSTFFDLKEDTNENVPPKIEENMSKTPSKQSSSLIKNVESQEKNDENDMTETNINDSNMTTLDLKLSNRGETQNHIFETFKSSDNTISNETIDSNEIFFVEKIPETETKKSSSETNRTPVQIQINHTDISDTKTISEKIASVSSFMSTVQDIKQSLSDELRDHKILRQIETDESLNEVMLKTSSESKKLDNQLPDNQKENLTPEKDDSSVLEFTFTETPHSNYEQCVYTWLKNQKSDDSNLGKTEKNEVSFGDKTVTEKAAMNVSSPDVLAKTINSYNALKEDNFLCTPKINCKGTSIMTPGAMLNKKKFVSRKIQEQLFMLNEEFASNKKMKETV